MQRDERRPSENRHSLPRERIGTPFGALAAPIRGGRAGARFTWPRPQVPATRRAPRPALPAMACAVQREGRRPSIGRHLPPPGRIGTRFGALAAPIRGGRARARFTWPRRQAKKNLRSPRALQPVAACAVQRGERRPSENRHSLPRERIRTPFGALAAPIRGGRADAHFTWPRPQVPATRRAPCSALPATACAMQREGRRPSIGRHLPPPGRIGTRFGALAAPIRGGRAGARFTWPRHREKSSRRSPRPLLPEAACTVEGTGGRSSIGRHFRPRGRIEVRFEMQSALIRRRRARPRFTWPCQREKSSRRSPRPLLPEAAQQAALSSQCSPASRTTKSSPAPRPAQSSSPRPP